jgi:dynein heavy chain
MGAMISSEKEQVTFIKKVDPKDKQVEYWMGDIEKMMCNSIRHVLQCSVEDYTERPRTEWVKCHPGQTVLNGSQVHWTNHVEDHINLVDDKNLQNYYDFCHLQLLDSVALVRTKLSSLEKKTMNALIVVDVHAQTVVQQLIDAKITNIDEYDWISQLRYYWAEDDVNKDGNCYVRCL